MKLVSLLVIVLYPTVQFNHSKYEKLETLLMKLISQSRFSKTQKRKLHTLIESRIYATQSLPSKSKQ